MKDFKNKHIWIIGASSGIGEALAKELSSRGAVLTLSARREDKLHELRKSLGDNHNVCPLDIADYQSVQAALSCAQKGFHRIDSVINLAALYEPGKLSELSLEKTRTLIDVNLMGMFNLIHTILPILQRQEKAQFVLCGSVAGFKGLPNAQPYSASKAAVINLAESLKAENPALDIKLINPGFVRTPLTDKNEFNMPMMVEPEQAAKAIADGLLKKSFEIHFPKRFTSLMKLLGILPYGLYYKLAKKMA